MPETMIANPSETLAAIDEIVDNFSLLDEWDDRYRYVIELGRSLGALPERERTEANKVQGCASQVWLATTVHSNERGGPVLTFSGDSDAHIVRGPARSIVPPPCDPACSAMCAAAAAGRGPFVWRGASEPPHSSVLPWGNPALIPTSLDTAPLSCCIACVDDA